jgi:hypothetical protein
MALAWSGRVEAANRFSISNRALPTGSTGNIIPILADNDEDLYGFSLSLEYDRTKVRIAAVQAGAAVAALTPDWNDGTVDGTNGRIVWGVVFGTSQATIDRKIAPGVNREVLKLIVDVIATTDTSTVLNLINRTTTDPIRVNVMTDVNGDSFTPEPALVDGTLTLENLAPTITAVSPGTGRVGVAITLTGTRFDMPGLAVTMCGAPVAGVQVLGATQVRFNAPECGVGPTDISVRNDFGAATRTNGFTYEAPPGNPIITEFLNNDGEAGDIFIVVGQNFDQPGLSVRVCGTNAVFTLLAPDTVQVEAPACAAGGWAQVQVCNQSGCDQKAQGFHYPEGTPFVRGDSNNDRRVDLSDGVGIFNDLFLGQPARATCRDGLDANDDGKVDVSDGVYILNFLFQGGPGIKPPFPDPGLDPTPDDLPSC